MGQERGSPQFVHRIQCKLRNVGRLGKMLNGLEGVWVCTRGRKTGACIWDVEQASSSSWELMSEAELFCIESQGVLAAGLAFYCESILEYMVGFQLSYILHQQALASV